jgi:hypothetical protein
MTIFDLLPPTPYEVARNYAIVMPAALADRLKSFQESETYRGCIASPVLLSDGRAALCADILTETAPGGLLSEAWKRIEAGRFANELEVVEWREIVPFLAQPVPTPEPLEGE